ncbi:hypothetical protein QUA41_05065 [Microcoleus sp. Pol11C1]
MQIPVKLSVFVLTHGMKRQQGQLWHSLPPVYRQCAVARLISRQHMGSGTPAIHIRRWGKRVVRKVTLSGLTTRYCSVFLAW